MTMVLAKEMAKRMEGNTQVFKTNYIIIFYTAGNSYTILILFVTKKRK